MRDASMDKELKKLADLGSFKMVPQPRGENVLQSTWSFKRKLYPDDSLHKYKAQFCIQGNQQIDGIDVFNTYAPAVSWITVFLLLFYHLFWD